LYVFGFNIPILELLVVLCVVVVGYLILLELEFRQLRNVAQKFNVEELELSKEIKILHDEILEVKDILQGRHKKN
jgi:hypothetical protein